MKYLGLGLLNLTNLNNLILYMHIFILIFIFI